MVVDFPEPLGPRKPWIWPRLHLQVKTVECAEGAKGLDQPEASMAGE